MNELFNALLDVSKLDAGALKPDISEFPIERLLNRIKATFAGTAREKNLSLRVVPSTAWVRSDFILLERVLLNLTANAIRYTAWCNSGVHKSPAFGKVARPRPRKPRSIRQEETSHVPQHIDLADPQSRRRVR